MNVENFGSNNREGQLNEITETNAESRKHTYNFSATVPPLFW